MIIGMLGALAIVICISRMGYKQDCWEASESALRYLAISSMSVEELNSRIYCKSRAITEALALLARKGMVFPPVGEIHTYSITQQGREFLREYDEMMARLSGLP